MWRTVVENLIPLIFVVVTPVVTMTVTMFLRKLAKKWDMEGALKYDEKLDELILKGIKAVEQKSVAAVRKGGEMTPGEKKLDDAMKFVNAQLAAMKLPEKAADQLSMLVESHLFDGAKAKEVDGAVVPKPDDAAVPAAVTP